MRNRTKKIFIAIVLGVYILTNFFQSAFFYGGNTVYAARDHETPIDYTNIVAILVNKNIYDEIKNDVQWYATNYIQGAGNNHYTSISNSKALVFPIDVDNFPANNIAQLLENIYFDGIDGEPSKLVGVVLIGDIPLPVVNQDGYIYPTIYPYVDFEEQKFIWDENSKYFIYNNNPKGQAEIWHGMINFEENISKYNDYFNKLKQYWRNPSKYIGKAIRYDDFIGNNKYFNDSSLNFYLNNFLFAEDLGYHRYSNLMVKVLQGQHNAEMAELLGSLEEISDDPYTGMDALTQMTDDLSIPTMEIKAMLDNGYLSSYTTLFGSKYLKTIKNNVETANRWIESRTGSDGLASYLDALDTHYTKTELTDEVALRSMGGLEPFIIMLNNALEEAVDKKVEQEKYRLDEVIPLTYLKYKGEKRWNGKCVWNIYDAYENYFFGENARFIQSMEETTTYRGTYRNYKAIDGLTIQSIQNSENPSTDISGLDLNKKSIGGSYEIFATQVDANRGYNYNNSVKEFDIYSGNKIAKIENRNVNCVSKFLGICRKRRWSAESHTDGSGCDLSEDGDQGGCESPIEYAMRIWGGASPLNLESDGSNFSWKSGYSYTGATSEIFDIGGSMALSYPNGHEYESNSFESINKYSNLILRKFSPDTRRPKFKSGNPLKEAPDTYGFGYNYSMDYDVKFTNKVPTFDGNKVNGWVDTGNKNINDVNFFDIFNPSATIEGDIIKIKKLSGGGNPDCQGAGEIYTYKTLDSRVKNDSVNQDELNGYSYEIFKDDRSRVKQLYSELLNFIDTVSGNVNAIVGHDTGSLVGNLGNIKDTIDDINEGFESIFNTNVNTLSNLNTGQIEVVANRWNRTFNIETINELTGWIKQSQDSVLDLSGFVDMGGNLFDGLVGFIGKEKEKFDVNGRELIFLDSRKDNLFGSINEILDNYENLNSIIVEAGRAYLMIDRLNNTNLVIQNLSGKKDNLSNLSGCLPKYQSLCNAIDNLAENYNTYAEYINSEKNGINNLKVQRLDDEGNPITGAYDTINDIFIKLGEAVIFEAMNNLKDKILNIGMSAMMVGMGLPPVMLNINEEDPLDALFNSVYSIPGTGNEDLLGFMGGMNISTSDRPIDSPRYLTFKGISGDKVTFIYPDLYKVEIFSGNSEAGILSLKSTGEIKIAIENYLVDVAKKYNSYLTKQVQGYNNYYNQNNQAYNLLNNLDPLATPNHVGDSARPYNLFTTGYFIDRLETSIRNSLFFSGDELAQSDPIGFIASMIYYQNISWPVKTIGETIQDDFDVQRTDFDINEKISYIFDNYLVSDNNKGNFLTPNYRDNGYEVAFINSDGNDYISYEVTPPIMNTISNFSSNYNQPVKNNNEKTLLEQEIINECNIPEEGGVLLFELSDGTITSPWRDAVECRWKKIKEKPYEFKIEFPFTWESDKTGFWDNLGDIFTAENILNILNVDAYEDIGKTYIQQLKLLDTNDRNEEIVNNLDLSNPGDAAKLWKILSYTEIKAKRSSLSADNAHGEIDIRSSVELGDIDFYIIDVGANKVKLLDGDSILSNNISIGSGAYSTGHITFDPYYGKLLSIEIDNPKEGMEVIMFYMCLPGTQNLGNCVASSVRFDVVPGEIKDVSIQMDRHIMLEGASLPFKVIGTDSFGNNVGELIAQKFETSSSSGNLTLNGVTSESIKFSNFNKSNFKINAVGGDLDNTTINIQVSGSIGGVPGIKARDSVLVKKGRIDVYSGSKRISSGANVIEGLTIKLPDENVYVNVDQYGLDQYQTGMLPKLELKLVDMDGDLLDIDGQVLVKTKSQRLNPGKVITKTITKNVRGQVVDVTQRVFGKTNYFDLSSGTCTVYLLPNFSAGDDVIYISMEGVDTIEIPVQIQPASAKVITLSAENEMIDTNSSTHGNAKVFDNWNNLIDGDISIEIKSVNDKISLSSSGVITVHSGTFDFDITSHDKGGLGHIYAYIDTHLVSLNQQKPATLSITVQQSMLPDKNLNVMYLNLFGNDRGNQRGYMSKNNKYAESLINNSDKLLTVTTQLLSLENIKYFPVIIDDHLQIKNLEGDKITLSLDNALVFNIESIGEISVNLNSFKLEAADISDEVLDRYITEIVANQKKGKNVLFYIPERRDSIIESNYVKNSAIYINDKKVFDISDFTFDKNLNISLSDESIAGYQVWQLYFGDTFIGKLLITANDKNNISMNLIPKSSEYDVSNIWIDGSSNKYGLGFYELKSQLSNNNFGYKSIQDSYDVMLGIGFTSDFKNITNFGGGMSVGEATVPFSSELLINIGDPLLKRIDSNETAKIYDENGNIKSDTEFDLGLGEVIYSEPGKEIFKVMNIDFNNDDLEDIIVIFRDGTIKILKNYGGTEPFQNLGTMMILADRISDVSIGDVDGNGYKDLIIWTESGWLRVYKNNGGIFDVDGYPACINVNVNNGEISDRPETISGLRQIFLEDMDSDGAIDIVTNDELGFIKIFYGGTTGGNVNYLSTNKYMCDDNWYNRIESKTVYQFGIKIDSTSHIVDQSLIHRKGISETSLPKELSAEDLGIDSSQMNGNFSMETANSILNNVSNFDVSAAESLYQQNQRFKTAGFDVIPVYESGITNESDIEYVEIGCLTGEDPVKIYKTYEDMNGNPIDGNFVDTTGSLVKGDMVRVTVNIIANDDFTGTFIDNILGPRIIPLSEYDSDTFEYFWFDSGNIASGYITAGQIANITGNIHWDLENARYMLDNISMKRGNKLTFSYGLVYNEYQAFDIEIDTLTGNDFTKLVSPRESLTRYSHDKYPDITIQPIDGCNDSMFVFFNNGSGSKRDYDQKFMDLGKVAKDYEDKSNNNGLQSTTTVLNNVGQAASNGDTQELMDQIGGFTNLTETLDWKGMLQNQGLLENISHLGDAVNLGMEILNSYTNNVEKYIDKIIGGSCNGINLSSLNLGGQGGCGLPVPFNQAFLGVGKYHIFGCYEIPVLSRTLGKGLPILHIPATVTTPVGTYPFIGAVGLPQIADVGEVGDGFLGVPGGVYPSMFRLYLMPTLTMDLGVALCFGPYGASKLIIDPLGSIAGNCVVFAVENKCGNSNSNNLGVNATTEIPYEYTLLKGCSKQNIPCYMGNNESFSPFVFGGSSENSYGFRPIIPAGSYAGGFINIEIKPETSSNYRENNSTNISIMTLEGGAQSQNKILGSKEQGLIDKIVKQRLDKQIKYIMNNLTNFKISVAWPDFEGMIGKVPSVNAIKESMNFNNTLKDVCEKNKGIWHENGSYCEDTQASLKLKCENKGMKRDQNSQLCTTKDPNISALDEWGQNNLPSRSQVSALSDYTNPFKKLSEIFKDTPLVNISTQDITIDVPMLSSEDITSYISMSQSRIERQGEILGEWKDFFTSIIGFCGGRTNISGADDLQEAINELKEKYKEADSYSQSEEDDKLVENLQGKINSLENLKKKYNLSDLGNYEIYEAEDGGFYVLTKYSNGINGIVPKDVYLYFNKETSELTMFTSGFNLIIDDSLPKTKISIEKNNQPFSNSGLNIKKDNESIYHSCAEIFMDGTIDSALNGFINLQSSAETFTRSIKQNIETLQLYKQFPLELYEWIHVGDRYLGDIYSLINSTMGTLSMWMETNANRYSQYIDAIITLMTTLETYQLIVDLSADWNESCSTCTNDNYDQFSCKLGGICDMLHIELPIVEIPPTKIPSFYFDFSEIHVETDIKLPSFKFNPVAVPLPKLPDIPLPPDIDLAVNLDEAANFGAQMLQNLIKELLGIDFKNININGNIPLIPSPPVLPELPSFVPSVEFELPVLPPAPKIPKLPNKIESAIKGAKIIGKILCIVKLKFGLVAETSIKAKVEQITQRDYEIPYWDNLDQTLSDWNKTATASMPSTLARIFTGFNALLQTNEFKETRLKGFDVSLQTYINLQFNFDDFYAFLERAVSDINGVSHKLTDYENLATNYISNISKKKADRLKACVNHPISIECLGSGATELVREYNEKLEKFNRYQKLLNTDFDGLGDALTQLENKKDRMQNLQIEMQNFSKKLQEDKSLLDTYTSQLERTTDENEREIILGDIEYIQADIDDLDKKITNIMQEIRELQQEINELDQKYGDLIESYHKLIEEYNKLKKEVNEIKENILKKKEEIMNKINEEIEAAEESVNFENLKILDIKIETGSQQLETQKNLDKQNRNENLQNLYKEVDGAISYVDYDDQVNENNIRILKDTLSEIYNQTKNKDIKGKAQEYLSLISMNHDIVANTESISNITNQYTSIINEQIANNENIENLIENNYDEFIAEVSNNKTSLVNDNSVNITLSTKLFDMEKNAIETLENQDHIIKKYMDYNMNNLQGYINALENNSAENLNMSDDVYRMSKEYLSKIKNLSDTVYETFDSTVFNDENQIIGEKIGNIENKVLVAQVGGNQGLLGRGDTSTSNTSSTSVDIANYIDGYTIDTKEGSFLLANKDYVNNFQSRFILTDINGTGGSDLILWDNYNVYIKYRGGNTYFKNTNYNNASKYYYYKIKSYESLLSDSDEGFVKMSNNLKVKLVDTNREVKNFKYAGQTFDTIKVSWQNSTSIGEEVDGYLLKMIHRVDQFSDKEKLINQGNNKELFDKKYILVLPYESEITGTKLEVKRGSIIKNIETKIGTGTDKEIFSVMYYNQSANTIDLTITDLPRNWQYSEIYTLNFVDDTYKISSTNSNQIVAGPQIIADDRGPDPTIKLYRPSIKEVVSQGISLEGYVGTNYTLQVDWEDNVALDRIWIANELGESLVSLENIGQQTGYIEYSGLYFTGEQNISFYIGGVDINGNEYITNATLLIKIPNIEITNILKGNQNLTNLNGNTLNSFVSQNNITSQSNVTTYRDYATNSISEFNTKANQANDSSITIVAQLDHDIDSGYVQFLRNRINDKREILTENNNISSFKVEPKKTEIYGGYFDIGNEVGLYLKNGDLIAKVNPDNGEITIMPGFKDSVSAKLDYTAHIPTIKIMKGNRTIFLIIFSGKELVDIRLLGEGLSLEPLDNELYGEFDGGQVVLKDGTQALLFISPNGQLYTYEKLYGDYKFDNSTDSVEYSFKTNLEGPSLGIIKIKIKNLLE